MGGKIDAYLDCVSPYSYYAMLHLLRNREILKSYDIEVEFIPIFLGGVNVGSGNKPPWTVPAKAAHGKFDGARAQKYFDVPNLKVPPFFPIMSLFPQRCMGFVKERYSKEKYEAAFANSWKTMWEDGLDISKPECMAKVLVPHFTEDEVKEILVAASDPKYKKMLNDNTQKALDLGAFGAPWFWVRNAEGKEEPFFGSDRFHFMWEYLGLPWSDVYIKQKDAKL